MIPMRTMSLSLGESGTGKRSKMLTGQAPRQ